MIANIRPNAHTHGCTATGLPSDGAASAIGVPAAGLHLGLHLSTLRAICQTGVPDESRHLGDRPVLPLREVIRPALSLRRSPLNPGNAREPVMQAVRPPALEGRRHHSPGQRPGKARNCILCPGRALQLDHRSRDIFHSVQFHTGCKYDLTPIIFDVPLQGTTALFRPLLPGRCPGLRWQCPSGAFRMVVSALMRNPRAAPGGPAGQKFCTLPLPFRPPRIRSVRIPGPPGQAEESGAVDASGR